jgi:hypothetical protein
MSSINGAPPPGAPLPTWTPDGAGQYKVNVTNKSDKNETVVVTGNDGSKQSITVPPHEVLPVELPENWGGNIAAHLEGSDPNAAPTLFEAHTGSGQGSNTSWDVSDIVGNNIHMHATAPGSSDVGDSDSTAPGAHSNTPTDDRQRPSPVKNTTGTEMDLEIG